MTVLHFNILIGSCELIFNIITMGMFRIKNPKETIFIICTGVLMLTLILLVSLIGKNLTYTTRFTPPST